MRKFVYLFTSLLIILLLVITYITIRCNYFEKESAIPIDAKLERRIEKTLLDMTLDEKIGQMCQITLDALLEKGPDSENPEAPYRLDPKKVDTFLVKYKVGSILNTAGNTAQSRDFWRRTIASLQEKAIHTTGIPLIYGVDAIHGVTYTLGGTLFPQQIAQAATFNTPLVKEIGRITAYETRASSIPWNFSPVLDLGRDARWPRMWETYGEDAFLAATLGAACVEGYQGPNPNRIDSLHVAACLKHYLGYGTPVSGLDRTPAYIPTRILKEKHFAPFKRAIEVGALSVMVNSSMVNGISLHASKSLLSQCLKTDLQWDGVLLTDWGDIQNLFKRDRVAANEKTAIANAINAGIDLSMVPFDWKFCVYLKELVIEKKVEIARINDAVRRILRLKYRLGLFDQPSWNTDNYPLFGSKEHADVALQAAEEAITLLKNEGNILPIPISANVLITGPNAHSMRTLNGGWTLSWQGEKADLLASEHHTILEAFQHRMGNKNVTYVPGVEYNMNGTYDQELPPDFSKLNQAAKQADYIVLCLGENSYCETPGNLFDLRLSDHQCALAKWAAKTGKPVILVLNEGRPRIVSSIEPLMAAVIQCYLPGNQGGDALANIVTGKTNPSGNLPYTYPRYPSVFYTYDHKPCEWIAYEHPNIQPEQTPIQWPFGHGLSYSKFTYSNLRISVVDEYGKERNTSTFDHNDRIVARITLTNEGPYRGKKSILLFTSDQYASLSPDVKRLRAFEKIHLEVGEKKEVRLEFPAKSLAFIQAENEWILENGEFNIRVGDLSQTIKCTDTYKWSTPNQN